MNGTTSTFPNNPASFGNDVQGAPWEYSFTFNIPGQYNYQCNPHSANMQGTIIVNPVTSIDAQASIKSEIKLYPMPVLEYLIIDFPDNKVESYESIQLYNLSGQLVYTRQIKTNEKVQLSLDHLISSIYFYRLYGSNGNYYTGKIIKK